MKLTEIENLPTSELKSRLNELVEAARKADVAELASRYIKARTDAASRDEKLSEQGRTISLLQSSLDEANKKAEKANAEANQLQAALEDLLEQQLNEVLIWKAVAKSRRSVLADTVNRITPLLAEEG